jgi:hypothetical protein
MALKSEAEGHYRPEKIVSTPFGNSDSKFQKGICRGFRMHPWPLVSCI